MKRNRLLLMLLACVLLLGACGAPAVKTPALSLQETVEKALNGRAGLVAFDLMDLVDITGMDETQIAECVYLTSADGLSAEEVIALRCTDKKHTPQVKQLLEGYLAQRLRETQNYLPDVYAVLKDAKVQVKNSTVLLATGAQADAWEKAILAGE